VPDSEHAPWDFSLTPARAGAQRDVPRRRGRGESEAGPQAQEQGAPSAEQVADLERGRTAALLAALGRVQVSLDVLNRKVGALDERIARLEISVRERGQ
jgi:hypothetical protein